MFSSQGGTAQPPADLFRVKCNVPTRSYEYPELSGTEYKTRADLYDLQNPRPATKEFLVKLLRFPLYVDDLLSHGSARQGCGRKVGRCITRDLCAKLFLMISRDGTEG